MNRSIFIAILLFLIIFNSSQGLLIKCRFTVGVSSIHGKDYRCTSLLHENSSTQIGGEITEVIGEHFSGFGNENVTSFSTYNGVTAVPRGLAKFFPNLKSLSIGYLPKITELKSDDLDEYGEKLEGFHITYTRIKEIPSNFFQKTPNLVIATFAHNKIEKVGRNLFKNVGGLKALQFNGNICINKNVFGPSNVPELIEELKVKCPYEDEENSSEIE